MGRACHSSLLSASSGQGEEGGRRLWEGPGDEPNVPTPEPSNKKIGISAYLRFGFGYSDMERWKPAIRGIGFD